ncbi:MAG TPA: hypothetical protein VID51_09950 [Solirubrobacterales bacterium]|jgi:hypothetical protein
MPIPEHLQMIQAIIDRLGRNSFLLKGWTVTLVAALIGLATAKSNADFALIAAAVSLVFGMLDAYYLAVERNYRALYNGAIADQSRISAWSLSAEKVTPDGFLRAFCSPTVLPLHGSAIACAVVTAIVA